MMTQSGFADINGAKIYYEVAGEGSALVLIHAGIADSRMWDDQFSVFAQDYQVVRCDLRGFGQSAPAAGAYAHYDDLHALLDVLGIERAVLLGCSLGGMAALDFALTYPDRAAGLILVGSGLGGYTGPEDGAEEDPPEAIEAERAFYAGDYERASEMEVRMWVDGPQRKPDQVAAAIRDKVRMMNTIALRNGALELGEERKLEPPAAQRLGEIRIPTLVIVGDLDQPDMDDIANRLAGGIVGAQKIVMTGTAHVPNMEQPGTFNQIVLNWLNSAAVIQSL